MHVKRLYRSTVREALVAAKEELGPDALVLSTELVPAAGWRGWIGQRVVRLTAAAERSVSEDRLGATVLRPGSDQGQTGIRRGSDHVDGPRGTMVAKLKAAGLDGVFANAIASRMTDAECRGGSHLAVRRAVAAELAAIVGADQSYARYEVFVGPPGVGKTTTIAKIAAQERAAGRAALGLVAADGFRAGAVEQLRAYASILNVPFRTARDSRELDAALASTPRQSALVDTAGRSPADPEFRELFQVIGRRRSVRTHLVLAADTSPNTARKIFERYAPLRPSRLVITKLDECESVAPLMTVVREQAMPVSYLSLGQRVPEDLARATPAALAAALLGEPALEAAS
jgi:flagellar biosynthesis protein FlhF